ncbi:alpha/beta hydrolase [Brachybacterium sp. AOP43-C2-M15]|uniref:alpha/beta hydrolase n=1 Tax=Brachybacterium sp. AOP43-C2-M15 TaxID=3457661 RepID=UPI004034BB11
MDIEKVDPALRTTAQRLPTPDLSRPLVRTAMRLATRIMPVPRTRSVSVATLRADGLRLRIHRPDTRRGDAGLLWVHGGGLLFGDARQDDPLCAGTALALGIPVVSVNYRLAPEHPFPAAHDDVHTAWQWMRAHAEELGIAAERIVIGGESAGGGLAAGLVQRLRDEGGAQPLAQWLFAPMLDDRTAADASLDEVGHWIWDNRANRFGWSAYLPGLSGTEDVPPYAAPARRADLSGLPPTYIAVGDIELFTAENAEYARRLGQHGVPAELDLVPGAPHGFENWAREAEPTKELLRRARGWLAEVLR